MAFGGHHVTLLATVAMVGAGALTGTGHSDARPAQVAPAVAISVGRAPSGGPIPAGFLGLSIEYWALEAYAGKDPGAVNPVLVQLIRNLAPGHATVLRIGGVTTDKTWWPVAGLTRPLGVNYSLDQRRLAVISALAEAVGARLIMGINLEADSPTLAAAEGRAMLAGIGRGRVEAFELGNEPELYANPNFGWYVRDGRKVPGRPPSYDFGAFTDDFSAVSAKLPPAPLAGPASGGVEWLSHLGDFVAAEPRLRMVTVHSYPMQACYNTPGSPTYPTIGRLLSPVASRGLADGVAPYLAIAHAHHLALRIDEMNTIACGNPPGVSDTFAMALWVLDALFADAQVGVDGVNIHTYPGAVYQLFTFKRASSSWQGVVEPEYYGLLMFSKAVPPGARLLQTSGGSGAVRVWATRDDHGSIRVLLINDDTAQTHLVTVRVAGARGAATLERLQAPSATATQGVTFAGQTFGPSTNTGLLYGQRNMVVLPEAAGAYVVRLPAASATLVTLR